MCIIYVVTHKIPSLKEFQDALKWNDHGNGVAWFGKDGMPHWKKDFPFKDASKIYQFIHDMKLPFPFMVHFRNATIGGELPELAHPFPITLGAETSLEGSAPAVMMHNGTWEGWEKQLKEAVIGANKLVKHRKNRLIIPDGEWSDSRAIAYMGAAFGIGFIRTQLADKRIAIMNVAKPGKILVLGSDQWTKDGGLGYIQSDTTSEQEKRRRWKNGCGSYPFAWGGDYESGSDTTSNSTTTSSGIGKPYKNAKESAKAFGDESDWYRDSRGNLYFDPKREYRKAGKAKPIPSWSEDDTHPSGCVCQICVEARRLNKPLQLKQGVVEVINNDLEDDGSSEFFTLEETKQVTQSVVMERKNRMKVHY